MLEHSQQYAEDAEELLQSYSMNKQDVVSIVTVSEYIGKLIDESSDKITLGDPHMWHQTESIVLFTCVRYKQQCLQYRSTTCVFDDRVSRRSCEAVSNVN